MAHALVRAQFHEGGESWHVEAGFIPWRPADGPDPLPLGRNIRHDSRSLRYAWRHSGAPPADVAWPRRIPILDQGQAGSCTGNAQTGCLGSDPLWATLPPGTVLDEAMALRLYSAAEDIDGDGPYPPFDNGSCGLSVCQAAKDAGLIGGYLHCLSLADILDALRAGPVIAGTNWYDSMDQPDGQAVVSVSPGAAVRGGHEYLVRSVDTSARMIGCDNSWGPGWGHQGSFAMSWETAERLLAEQGDVTASTPLGLAPAPSPG